MPIYEFKCDECEHIQEEVLRFSQLSDIVIICEKCGSPKTKRLIPRPNGVVKGTQTPTRS